MIEKDKIEEIEDKIKECEKCSLSEKRKFPVPGKGNHNAEIMLIGLGPGYHENICGEPFVGKAGKFLDELLQVAELKREEIYITNIIKCYLPDNRPTQEQINICSPYLDSQIEVIKPRIIITLGNVSTQYIFKKFGLKPASMGKMHGENFLVQTLHLQAKIIPMYHPASALYNPNLKEILKKEWENLKILI